MRRIATIARRRSRAARPVRGTEFAGSKRRTPLHLVSEAGYAEGAYSPRSKRHLPLGEADRVHARD